MAKSCLGLDVGSYQIKIAEVVKQGRSGFRINQLVKFVPPKRSIENHKLLDPNILGTALNRVLVQHGIKTDRVVLGLNSPDILIRQASLPQMGKKELEQAIELDLADILNLPSHLNKEAMYHSFDIASEVGGTMEVVVVACPKSLLDPYISMMKKADLEPTVIDISAFSLPRINPSFASSRVCFVDLGYSQTVIYIELNGVYGVYRILPLGGRLLDEAIAEAFAVDLADAQRLRSELSLEELLTQGTGSKSLLRSVVQQYVGGLLQTLDYLRSKSRASAISEVLEQVVLLGGMADVKGFDTILQQELDIEVTCLNPLTNFSLANNLEVPQDYGVYANAIGLAVRGLTER